MLAYIFWHRPHDGASTEHYEESLLGFHRRLSEEPLPGFRGSGAYRISAVPWLDDRAGYEDWCHVEASWALDPLNSFAVAGRMKAPHDAAAAQMESGHGGLYSLMWGNSDFPDDPTITWLTRPRGIDWRSVLDPLRTQFPHAACWRRHMVLGPAPEFALVQPSGAPVPAPDGWTALVVNGKLVKSPQ